VPDSGFPANTLSYNREPPCSSYTKATECSQFFHNIQITNLAGGQTYYYQIQAANGTTQSDVLSFVTAPVAGTSGEFSAILLNDMGYTNAQGTHRKMLNMIEEEGIAFALHGGDIVSKLAYPDYDPFANFLM